MWYLKAKRINGCKKKKKGERQHTFERLKKVRTEK